MGIVRDCGNHAMTADNIGMQLHDRSTRGEVLTPEESRQLESWYSLQDAEESALLQESHAPTDIFQLRLEVKAALSQLTETTQRVQQVTQANDLLRSEISAIWQKINTSKSA
ncbi:MAG: hypothetical protein AAFN38_22580 [Cyanobacteria bacterium J06560_5]